MEKSIEKLGELIKIAENSRDIRSKDLQPYVSPDMLFAYYESGETIIQCGQKLSEIIYIVKGEFSLTRNSMEGNQVMIARVWGARFSGDPPAGDQRQNFLFPDIRHYRLSGHKDQSQLF